jgi:hypothetical protein
VGTSVGFVVPVLAPGEASAMVVMGISVVHIASEWVSI